MLRVKSIDELRGKHVRDSALRESGMHLGAEVSGGVRSAVGAGAASGGAPEVSGRRGEEAREITGGRPESGHRKVVARGAARESGMNKVEASYAKHLEAMKSAGQVLWWKYEAVGLRLADRTFYHPDFMVMMADGSLEITEIKGRKGDSYYCMDDAKVKIKVAAAQFPMRFSIVWPSKSGGWNREDV